MEMPKKTSEWQSGIDLRNDKTFPMGDTMTINRKLQELQDQMPEYIQRRQAKSGQPALCLRRDGRELFLEKTGYKYYPPKTSAWKSANQLAKDRSFPMQDGIAISEKMKKLQHEMPDYIQMRKPKSGLDCLCLRGDGLDLFLEKIGYVYYPPKTSSWQSAMDLEKDKNFPMANKVLINKKMQEFQHEMPGYIQIRKPIGAGKSGLCLYKKGWDLFLEKVGYKSYPPKTLAWQSATDLQQDRTFPMTGTNIINKKLEELQHEMPEYIQIRKPARGQSGLCLHREGRQEFIKRVQEIKTKSLTKATAVVAAMDEARQVKPAPDKQYNK